MRGCATLAGTGGANAGGSQLLPAKGAAVLAESDTSRLPLWDHWARADGGNRPQSRGLADVSPLAQSRGHLRRDALEGRGGVQLGARGQSLAQPERGG